MRVSGLTALMVGALGCAEDLSIESLRLRVRPKDSMLAMLTFVATRDNSSKLNSPLAAPKVKLLNC